MRTRAWRIKPRFYEGTLRPSYQKSRRCSCRHSTSSSLITTSWRTSRCVGMLWLMPGPAHLHVPTAGLSLQQHHLFCVMLLPPTITCARAWRIHDTHIHAPPLLQPMLASSPPSYRHMHTQDLKLIVSTGLLRHGGIVIADNILIPGVPQYLQASPLCCRHQWRVLDVRRVSTTPLCSALSWGPTPLHTSEGRAAHQAHKVHSLSNQKPCKPCKAIPPSLTTMRALPYSSLSIPALAVHGLTRRRDCV